MREREKMKTKYVVLSKEEMDAQASSIMPFISRTPYEAIRKHDEFFIRKKELFGNCDCFIGTIFKKEVKKNGEC